jgi:hypothetical protein
MLLGIAMGLMMSIAGLSILNTQLSVTATASNPTYSAPIVGAFAWTGALGPETFEQEMGIEGLNGIIFSAYLSVLAIILFSIAIVLFLLSVWFGPSVLFLYSVFAIFTIITFLLVYWLGSAYLIGGS